MNHMRLLEELTLRTEYDREHPDAYLRRLRCCRMYLEQKERHATSGVSARRRIAARMSAFFRWSYAALLLLRKLRN